MPTKSVLFPVDLFKLSDWLAIAAAISIPWSTSATGILVGLWLLALVPTLDWMQLRRLVLQPAGGLPIALILLACVGTLWAEVSWHDRWGGLGGFVKLLPIPLFMVQFRRSENGYRVFVGFLIGCLALLLVSYAIALRPQLWDGTYGVPVKSYMAQSLEFSLCAAVLAFVAIENIHSRNFLRAGALLFVAAAFLANVFFVATSRTSIFILLAWCVTYGFWRGSWKGILAAVAIAIGVAGVIWTSSPYLRSRVGGILTESQRFETEGTKTSTGERIVFWTRSLQFVANAPVIGHGTGSIPTLFREAAVGQKGVYGELTVDPHNQYFVVAIQLGGVGLLVLCLMWLAQARLFWSEGLCSWIGLATVTAMAVGSLSFSMISNFTEGWLYTIAIGVAGGIRLRNEEVS